MRLALDAITGATDPRATLREAALRALGASHFLRRALAAEGLAASGPAPAAAPEASLDWLLALAAAPWGPERLRAELGERAGGAAGLDEQGQRLDGIARALRRTRRRLLCALLVRASAHLAPLEEVTGSMTAFAQLAVRELLAVLAPQLAQQLGVPVDARGEPQDLLVLAMGKAGTGELNVSSDLDLIFVYGDVVRLEAPAGAPAARSAHEAPGGQQFFERLGRRLIGALAEPGDEGFVFRVDMRLRPHGDAGPLVVSTPALEEYLVREGREWERFAWAKARVVSAPVLAPAGAFARQCAALEAIVQPFVYRKYLDFGAIGAIRDLHRRIRAESLRRPGRRDPARAEASPDIKLGRGGIREVEFIAQTFAIIRGGRDARLRSLGTVATLQWLPRLGLMSAGEAERLAACYRFLRELEHALQWRDDAQTHAIPADEAGRAEAAALLGSGSAAQLLEQYRACSDDIARSFDAMFPADARAPAAPAEAGVRPLDAEALAGYGLVDPAAAAERLQRLLRSPRMAALSAPTRAVLGKLALQALATIRDLRARPDASAEGLMPVVSVSADEMLLRWIRLVEVIGRRSTYFALLSEYPRAHERVLRLLAAGGWPTEFLLRHPILLDELVDLRVRPFAADPRLDDVDAPPGAAEPLWQPWVAETGELLQACAADPERQMNLLRDAHHAQVFGLLLADLEGALRLERLADHLSALADGVLALVLRAAWDGMDEARAPGARMPRLAILAYGKLGGRELGYASDLDLAFVYEPGAGGEAAERDAALCTRLVRRVIAWLTTATSSGILFDIDLRLRPNGNAGLLVTPIEAFERYQCNADGHGAWIWEHQALTRARACAGDAALGRRIEALRARVLAQARDPTRLAEEVLAMRRRMLEGHVNRSMLFDLKHDRGGMVDIEFVVQYLVLAHAHRHAELIENRGNIGLLRMAAALGLIDADQAAGCAGAYRRYRRLQHAMRLDGVARPRVHPAAVHDEITVVSKLWRAVFATDEPRPPGR